MDDKFTRLENMFLTGRIQEALRDIESIEQNRESSYKDKVTCKMSKSFLPTIFQGYSYLAIKKMQIFLTDMINSSNLSNKLILELKHNEELKLDDRILLSNYLKELFFK